MSLGSVARTAARMDGAGGVEGLLKRKVVRRSGYLQVGDNADEGARGVFPWHKFRSGSHLDLIPTRSCAPWSILGLSLGGGRVQMYPQDPSVHRASGFRDRRS